jgi:UDP-GlcNAc3NAcA epimerase
MLKILTIVGARPQFIKAATISRVVASRSDIKEVIVHTGQHFDKNMSNIFFEEMQIPKPDYNLHIASLSHGAMTGRMLEETEKIILAEKPDWVIVYGDTNSTLAGALAASKLHIRIAHVEAGLRSYNMKMPEEQNRILTDRISSVLFCPSATAEENLKAEYYENFGIQIFNSGDVMYDASMFYYERAIKPVWFDALNINDGFALATVHRAENTDHPKRLREIVLALNEIHRDKPVILPLHPRTKKMIESLDVDLNVYAFNPVGYLEMVYLLKHCEYVLSDSGGVQKEAYFFRKRCIILRDETEWTELIEHGANQLVGAVKVDILSAVAKLTDDVDFAREFYGDGTAANKIVNYLHDYTAD